MSTVSNASGTKTAAWIQRPPRPTTQSVIGSTTRPLLLALLAVAAGEWDEQES